MPQRRVGVVASYDFERDRELWRWAPPEVTLFMARTAPVSGGDPLLMSSALARPEHLARPTREVCAIGAEVVVLACTACSFVAGAAGERALRRAMLDFGAPTALTTGEAVVDAFAALRVRRIAVVHPYPPHVARRLRGFLADSGLDVARLTGRELARDGTRALSYADVAALARDGDDPGAEALFLGSTALPSYDLIAPLEEELGKPVVSANQAVVWAALRALGTAAYGPGQRLVSGT
ncbi:decarboxylase [Streptantibioticus cattleyicolor NRRL 8057 = DSM 46488]|uniref:Decarboxylase n=1 Tax=Streptantibioticus cattleyicolor (strain ATCC 35852 / DSM 46488 / JCM 4925 / NBRC 14057 / NRRL 8057) TaxID=1003195 RepID=G8WY68_STREN|nr:decarboxylase [Streptantibioticus cattleyicolor NRRL 8057 = DSM 46488]